MGEAEFVLDDVDAAADHFGGLLGGHAAEVPHLNCLGGVGMLRAEFLEGEMQIQQPDQAIGAIHHDGQIDSAGVASAFRGTAGPGMIHQNSAHDARRQGKEVSPIAEERCCLAEHAKVSFVDERGGLESMVLALLA
jgi:hypothetical protein